jgi:hypothetical protein
MVLIGMSKVFDWFELGLIMVQALVERRIWFELGLSKVFDWFELG